MPKIQAQAPKHKSRHPNTSPDNQIQVQTPKIQALAPKNICPGVQNTYFRAYIVIYTYDRRYGYILQHMAVYGHIWTYIATHIYIYICIYIEPWPECQPELCYMWRLWSLAITQPCRTVLFRHRFAFTPKHFV